MRVIRHREHRPVLTMNSTILDAIHLVMNCEHNGDIYESLSEDQQLNLFFQEVKAADKVNSLFHKYATIYMDEIRIKKEGEDEYFSAKSVHERLNHFIYKEV